MNIPLFMLIGCVFYWIVSGIAVFVWYKRNQQPVLKHRKIEYVFTSIAGALVGSTMLATRIWFCDQFPCALYIIMSSVFILSYCLPYLIRLIVHNKMMNWNKQLMESVELESYMKSFDSVKKEIVYAKTFIIFVAVILHICFILYSFYNTISGYGTEAMKINCEFQEENLVLFGLFSLYSVCIIVFFWKLRKFKDRFWVRWEMGFTMIVWIIVGILFFFINLTDFVFFDNSSIFDLEPWMFGGLGISILISLILPIIRSYCVEKNNSFVNLFVIQIRSLQGYDDLKEDDPHSYRKGGEYDMELGAFNETKSLNSNQKEEEEEEEINQLTSIGDPSTITNMNKVFDNYYYHLAFMRLCMSYLDLARYKFVADVHKYLIINTFEENGIAEPVMMINDDFSTKNNLALIYKKYLSATGMCSNVVRKCILNTSASGSLNYIDSSMFNYINCCSDPSNSSEEIDNHHLETIGDNNQLLFHIKTIYSEITTQLELCYLREFVESFKNK